MQSSFFGVKSRFANTKRGNLDRSKRVLYACRTYFPIFLFLFYILIQINAMISIGIHYMVNRETFASVGFCFFFYLTAICVRKSVEYS